jgi:hypothetical protein
VLPDNSSNTITSTIVLQGGPPPDGLLGMICFYVVFFASQPDADRNVQLGKINDAFNRGEPITLNGWTYSSYSDDKVITLSATRVNK